MTNPRVEIGWKWMDKWCMTASYASRHTVKDHLKALVDQGHLALHGAGRGAWYGLS